MKIYNNFFVGLPLPDEFHKNYTRLLAELKKVDPKLKISKTPHPHITIIFMGKQQEGDILEVGGFIKEQSKYLKGCKIELDGISFFSNNKQDVIFLKTSVCSKAVKLHETLAQKFSYLFKNKKENFYPHLTLARTKTVDKNLLKRIEQIKSNNTWEFTVKKINLYVRDPQKGNHQFVIHSIDLS
jgi:2'-5' RNA ligase